MPPIDRRAAREPGAERLSASGPADACGTDASARVHPGVGEVAHPCRTDGTPASSEADAVAPDRASDPRGPVRPSRASVAVGETGPPGTGYAVAMPY